MTDGVIRSAPLPPNLEIGWEGLARSVTDLVNGELELTLQTGESLTLDLGWSDGADVPPAGLPIVYLDQNHWVTLAQQVCAPEKVREPDRDAANTLVRLARSRAVVLPLSSAHLTETAPTGKHRRDLALTMVGLSRGWQMRNPLEVRRRELAAAISGEEPRCARVVTLEPDVIFDQSTPVSAPAAFPPVWQEMHCRVVSATAIVAAMLDDDEPGHRTGAAERQRWLDAYRAHSARVQNEKLSRDDARQIAHATLLADFRDETIAAAASVGVTDEELSAWLTNRSAADYEQAPQLRTLQEVLYHRLRNRDDQWKGNDLLDMHFLSCAAGYSDLVVGEKKFADYLKRARRRHPGNAEAVATLAEAVAVLS